MFNVIWPPGSPPELPVLLYPDFSCRQQTDENRLNLKKKKKKDRKKQNRKTYQYCKISFNAYLFHVQINNKVHIDMRG